MSFDELQKKWQSHDHGTLKNFDAGLLLNEVRHNQRALEAAVFRRDCVESGLGVLMTCFWGYGAIYWGEWGWAITAIGCLFVGTFIVVDRWVQRRRRPASDSTLISVIRISLDQINHQIWLLRNIFWWYLTPLGIGLLAFFAPLLWKNPNGGLNQQNGLGISVLVCLLVFWGVYYLNQIAVKRSFIPRREELETLLASLDRTA